MSGVNLERVFDILCHIGDKSTRGTDYNLNDKVVLTPYQQSEVLNRSIQAFFQKVGNYEPTTERVIQAFSGSSDLPVLTKDVFNVVNTVPNYDTLWQGAFKAVKLLKGQLSWEIADIEAGFSFEIIPEGGKCKIYSLDGNKTTANIQKYGAGIGVTWEMTEGRKLYQFIDMMEQVRSRLVEVWADTHYGLLATAAALNAVSYQGLITDPVLDRDIKTLNVGYTTIGDAVKDKGYGDVANVEMLVYANPSLKARLNQAFRAANSDSTSGRNAGGAGAGAGNQVVEFNITPKYSWNSQLPANKGVMVLPGNKIQNSAYMRELALGEKDVETLNDVKTYWSAFGAIVADSDQCAELAFA